MPEGDTLWRTARTLHQAFVGRPLAGADLRVPKLATVDLAGRATIEVVARGKHLLHRFEGDLTLHSHLRMDGSWRVRPLIPGRRPGGSHTVRALLWTGRQVAIGDQLGMLDLVRTANEDQVVGHLGPDLLDPAFDAELAVANLLRDPRRPVAEACLDQRNLAGMGTIFTSEPLFVLGINPWTPIGEIAGRLPELVALTRRMLQRSIKSPFPVTTDSMRPTPGQSWVHGRLAEPCRRCGRPIRVAKVGLQPTQRIFFYCPTCQGGLAPGDDGSTQAPIGHHRGPSSKQGDR